MHPRISVHGLCGPSATFSEDLEFWNTEKIDHVGVPMGKLNAFGRNEGIRNLIDGGFQVSGVMSANGFTLDNPALWAEQQAGIIDALNAAQQLSAGYACISSGAPGRLFSDEAAVALASAIGPVLAHAKAVGVSVAIEHSNAARHEAGFLHTLRDTVEYSREIGFGVCVEMQNCWVEPHLQQLLRDSVDTFSVVQLSDWRIGDAGVPNRSVLGDGDIPLERLLDWLLSAGYGGALEIEILGPRIEAEGHRAAVRRSIDWLTDTLVKLGV